MPSGVNKSWTVLTVDPVLLMHLSICAASRHGRVQKVTSAADGVHGVILGIDFLLVVVVAHYGLHGIHVNHLCTRGVTRNIKIPRDKQNSKIHTFASSGT